MAVHAHHEDLIEGIYKQFKPVLDKTPQAAYIYLDDAHKACNQKMADLVGMGTPKEWAAAEAPLSDVVEEDQPAVIQAYTAASEKMTAGHLHVRVKNAKNSKVSQTDMVIVPLAFDGHIMTMQFFSQVLPKAGKPTRA